ncbi:Dihydroneopterin aldolase [wastewater metagenome]|uniref:dihydroneopterin aldolase n=2 Tax=unclassified sequences TaxID=12908 RepID=A0A5B8R7E0_9ZZZZ|nr:MULTISPECIES: dihydroneopterin aldolase [Arhodomonas]MCS4505277.1 dihydroneopterin aldolase [Arhodomonas aquaeolei]QEA05019.1 dihydroneopterin aldolase [uncultured organism]
MDSVFIEGLELRARIGVWDWERALNQRLRLDLELAADVAAAAASDELADAVSYADVAAWLVEAAGASDFRLLEALAEHLADGVRTRFGVSWLRLSLTKPGAVAGARGVGVRIERGATGQA